MSRNQTSIGELFEAQHDGSMLYEVIWCRGLSGRYLQVTKHFPLVDIGKPHALPETILVWPVRRETISDQVRTLEAIVRNRPRFLLQPMTTKKVATNVNADPHP